MLTPEYSGNDVYIEVNDQQCLVQKPSKITVQDIIAASKQIRPQIEYTPCKVNKIWIQLQRLLIIKVGIWVNLLGETKRFILFILARCGLILLLLRPLANGHAFHIIAKSIKIHIFSNSSKINGNFVIRNLE